MSQAFTSSNRNCYTCAYWGGSRSSLVSSNENVNALVIESTDARGSCMSPKNRGAKRAFDLCEHYSKLSILG